MVLGKTWTLANSWIPTPRTTHNTSTRRHRNVRASPTPGTRGAASSTSSAATTDGGSNPNPSSSSSSNQSINNNSSQNPPLEPPAPTTTTTASSPWSLVAEARNNWPLLLRTFAVHAAHITVRLLSQPFQPALDKFQEKAAASSAVRAACAALQVEDLTKLQDVVNSLVLAESVYKVVGRPEGEAIRLMSALKAAFPPGVVTLSAAQFTRSHVRHRFAVAESPDAMYVVFMGTKLARDFLANATVWQDEVLLDASSVLNTDDAERFMVGSGNNGNGSNGSNNTSSQSVPAAHRGFLTRARGIPIDSIFNEAQKRGKRLVLCG